MVAVATHPPRTYECARCGKRRRAANMIFSKYTRNRYCAACVKQVRKVKR